LVFFSEIIRGGVCGRGEFGVVEEVAAIYLREETQLDVTSTRHQSLASKRDVEDLQPTELLLESSQKLEVHDDQSVSTLDSPSLKGSESCDSIAEMKGGKNNCRSFMSKRCIRGSKPRYAIKRIHPGLDVDLRIAGITDLAVEAHFLAVLNHTNIIKLRGTSSADPISPGYFLVLDRLECTLQEKITEWTNIRKRFYSRNSFFKRLVHNKSRQEHERGTALKDLFNDRIMAAYDISRAMRYIHNHKYVSLLYYLNFYDKRKLTITF